MPIESLRDIQRAAVSAFAAGGGGSFTEASTAPGSPSIGDRWLDTTSGIEYTWITPGVWVDLATAGIDFDDLVQTTGAQSIAGVKTFTDSPVVPAGATGDEAMQAQEVVALSRGQNRLLNPRFNINNLAVSGTVVLAAGAYGHDGWKAGAGGCTYTFATSAGVTTLTISAGTLVQTMEGAELESGTHVLSWTGTAQGRIAGGSYGASGITGSVTGGTNTDVEFNTGTLAKPQLEPGSTPKPFQHRGISFERMLCNRHCCILYWGFTVGNATDAQSFGASVSWPVPMFATPTVTDLSGGTVVNASAVTIDTATTEGARIFLTTTGAGAATVHNRRIRAVARL